jgi:hypothetical protein
VDHISEAVQYRNLDRGKRMIWVDFFKSTIKFQLAITAVYPDEFCKYISTTWHIPETSIKQKRE